MSEPTQRMSDAEMAWRPSVAAMAVAFALAAAGAWLAYMTGAGTVAVILTALFALFAATLSVWAICWKWVGEHAPRLKAAALRLIPKASLVSIPLLILCAALLIVDVVTHANGIFGHRGGSKGSSGQAAEEKPCIEYFGDYGIAPATTTSAAEVYAVVNVATIRKYADRYRAVLIIRADWPDLDEMTDRNIAKSIPYTIVPDNHTLRMVIENPRLRMPSVRMLVVIDEYLVVLPKDVSPDNVLSLSDVKKVGGTIVFSKGFRESMKGSPVPQPPQVDTP